MSTKHPCPGTKNSNSSLEWDERQTRVWSHLQDRMRPERDTSYPPGWDGAWQDVVSRKFEGKLAL